MKKISYHIVISLLLFFVSFFVKGNNDRNVGLSIEVIENTSETLELEVVGAKGAVEVVLLGTNYKQKTFKKEVIKLNHPPLGVYHVIVIDEEGISFQMQFEVK